MGPMRRRARRRGIIVGAAAGAAVSKKNAKKQAQQSAPDEVSNGLTAQLEELNKLKSQGILTQDEFDAKKKQILGI